MNKEFTCARCGRTFESENTEEDAKEEFDELWGNSHDYEDSAVICDDCFKEIVPNNKN